VKTDKVDVKADTSAAAHSYKVNATGRDGFRIDGFRSRVNRSDLALAVHLLNRASVRQL
jgi:hypothetical protein